MGSFVALLVKLLMGGVGWADEYPILSLPTQRTAIAESIFAMIATPTFLLDTYAARPTHITIGTCSFGFQSLSDCWPAKVADPMIAMRVAE